MISYLINQSVPKIPTSLSMKSIDRPGSSTRSDEEALKNSFGRLVISGCDVPSHKYLYHDIAGVMKSQE